MNRLGTPRALFAFLPIVLAACNWKGGLKGFGALQNSELDGAKTQTCLQPMAEGSRFENRIYKSDYRYSQMVSQGRGALLLSRALESLGGSSERSDEIPANQSTFLFVEVACARADVDAFIRRNAGLFTFESLDLLHSTSQSRIALGARLARAVTPLELESRLRSEPCVLALGDNSEISRERLTAYFEKAPDTANPQGSKNPYVHEQFYVDQLEAREAFEYFYHPVKGITAQVVVAVVDSGIRSTHVDLRHAVWKQADGKVGYTATGDGKGPAEDTTPINHGTKVSGIIAMAHDNQQGGAGLTLKHVKIMASKFVVESAQDPQGGSGTALDRFNAVQFVIDSGVADVMNFSFGSANFQASFRTQIEMATAKKIFIAASAGNDGVEMTAQRQFYPASWGSAIPGLMSVGGTAARDPGAWWVVRDKNNQVQGGSNYSNQLVEIAAQAQEVFTTTGYVSTATPQLTDFGYAWSHGTSFSAPMVSAAAALVIGMLKTHGISYTAADVEEIIRSGAREVAALNNRFVSGRRLSLKGIAEVMKARYPQTDPDYTAPVVADSPAGAGEDRQPAATSTCR